MVAQQSNGSSSAVRPAVDDACASTADGPVYFECMDPEAPAFPPPAIPVLPYLTLEQIALRRHPLPSFLRRPHAFFRNGRSALASVLVRENLRGRRILVPGYMCKSVIEPVIWSQSTPVFFALDDELNVDLDDFESKVTDADAAIVTHFFGMPQVAITRIAEICRANDVLLIEDCAHAYLGEVSGRSLGSFGDYAIASTVKFCPGVEGGLLVANGRQLEREMYPRWSSLRLRSAVSILDRCVSGNQSRRRHGGFDANSVPSVPAWRAQRLAELEVVPDANGRYEWFDPADVAAPGDALSYKLLYFLDYEQMRRVRRDNFAKYVEAFANAAGCAPMVGRLRPGTVPYMFPLYVEDIEAVFRTLKYQRIPIWRWEQQHVDVPAVGKRYGRNLLHLPCHQCLGPQDVAAIAAAIVRVIDVHRG